MGWMDHGVYHNEVSLSDFPNTFNSISFDGLAKSSLACI